MDFYYTQGQLEMLMRRWEVRFPLPTWRPVRLMLQRPGLGFDTVTVAVHRVRANNGERLYKATFRSSEKNCADYPTPNASATPLGRTPELFPVSAPACCSTC